MSDVLKDLHILLNTASAKSQSQGKTLFVDTKVSRVHKNSSGYTCVVSDKQNYRVSLNFQKQLFTCTCFESHMCCHVCAALYYIENGDEKLKPESFKFVTNKKTSGLFDLAIQFDYDMRRFHLLKMNGQQLFYVKTISDLQTIQKRYSYILKNISLVENQLDVSQSVDILVDNICATPANVNNSKEIKFFLHDGTSVQFEGLIKAKHVLKERSDYSYTLNLSFKNPEKRNEVDVFSFDKPGAGFFHSFGFDLYSGVANQWQEYYSLRFDRKQNITDPKKDSGKPGSLKKFYMVKPPALPEKIQNMDLNHIRYESGLSIKDLLIQNGVENAESIPPLWQTGPELALFISPEIPQEQSDEKVNAKDQLKLSTHLNLVYAKDKLEMKKFLRFSEAEDDKPTPVETEEPEVVFIPLFLKSKSPYQEIIHEGNKTILFRDFEKEHKLLFPELPVSYKKSTGEVRLSVKRIRSFVQETLPVLKERGVVIRIHKDLVALFKKAYWARFQIESSSEIQWFDATAQIDGISERDRAALIKAAKQKQELVQIENGMWLNPEDIGLTKILSQIERLGLNLKQDGSVERISAGNLYALVDTLDVQTDKKSTEMIHRLQKMSELPDINYNSPGENFNGKLRSYQKTGVAFFRKLFEYESGGILADDMGLGKTVQTLAFINKVFEDYPKLPCLLLVTPLSALSVWEQEAKKFFPKLKLYRWHSTTREKESALKHRIILTTYATLNRDYKEFENNTFSMLILDEAQAIKNHATVSSLALRQIKATRIYCLTGTPLENRLSDLWSLIDICVPGLFGTRTSFLRTYDDASLTKEDVQVLKNRMKPFLLRRHKEEVLKQLPPKIESDVPVTMTKRQKLLHEKIRFEALEALKKSQEKYLFVMLPYLMKLRRIACHPDLENIHTAEIGASGKLQFLENAIPELMSSGSGILIFSQFTDVLKLTAELLKNMNLDYFYLDGSTTQKKRQTQVEDFQQGKKSIFLISLKAGGSALTLHRADTVIHLDPWWNPQAENQATDRSHRIGQKKQVSVYRLFSKDSIEEKVLVLKKRKQALFNGIFADGGFNKTVDISKEEMIDLLSGENPEYTKGN